MNVTELSYNAPTQVPNILQKAERMPVLCTGVSMARKRVVKINGSKANGSTKNGVRANGSQVHLKAHIKKEEHPTGLWVDADVFARLRSGNGETLKKETFSATQHYLDLAALVLDGKKERKKRSRNKNSNGSAAE